MALVDYIGAGGKKMKMYEPIYLDNRVLKFLREWPKVSTALRPAYSHLWDCGAMWLDPQGEYEPGDYPGNLRLSSLGHALKDEVDAQTMNFFRVADMVELFRNTADGANPNFDMFLRLFRGTDGQVVTAHSADVRHYTGSLPVVARGQEVPFNAMNVRNRLAVLESECARLVAAFRKQLPK